jgi:NhaA family Na+:H+ antiporter
MDDDMDRGAAHERAPERRPLDPLREFLAAETAGATLIAVAAVVALVWANSPWQHGYESLWHRDFGFTAGGHHLGLDLHAWVNDALMTIFFLLVGLEIKREITFGSLSGRRAALTPVIAAIGGMLVPAAVYLAIAGRTASHGWAIPMATDIALAVGVVAVVGDRIPSSLRALLLGLAVVDDIGGIIVIAAVYSTGIRWTWLAAAIAAIALAGLVSRLTVPTSPALVVLGVFAWTCLHAAGIHPTLSGVAIGLLVPAAATTDAPHGSSLVELWEHVLHPWSSFLIVPVFALANSGIEISAHQLSVAVRSPVTWGVLLGLLIGKPVGVLLGVGAGVRSGVASRPEGASWRHITGIATTAGIGFTVALFITELAFDDPAEQSDAKLAILAGSVLSAIVAMTILVRPRRQPAVKAYSS